MQNVVIYEGNYVQRKSDFLINNASEKRGINVFVVQQYVNKYVQSRCFIAFNNFILSFIRQSILSPQAHIYVHPPHVYTLISLWRTKSRPKRFVPGAPRIYVHKLYTATSKQFATAGRNKSSNIMKLKQDLDLLRIKKKIDRPYTVYKCSLVHRQKWQATITNGFALFHSSCSGVLTFTEIYTIKRTTIKLFFCFFLFTFFALTEIIK